MSCSEQKYGGSAVHARHHPILWFQTGGVWISLPHCWWKDEISWFKFVEFTFIFMGELMTNSQNFAEEFVTIDSQTDMSAGLIDWSGKLTASCTVSTSKFVLTVSIRFYVESYPNLTTNSSLLYSATGIYRNFFLLEGPFYLFVSLWTDACVCFSFSVERADPLFDDWSISWNEKRYSREKTTDILKQANIKNNCEMVSSLKISRDL